MAKLKLLDGNGTPVPPKETPPPPHLHPESKFRRIRFNKSDNVHHIFELKHGQTYQCVACEPDTFSGHIGKWYIHQGGMYHTAEPRMTKDAIGRPKQIVQILAPIYEEDEAILEETQ